MRSTQHFYVSRNSTANWAVLNLLPRDYISICDLVWSFRDIWRGSLVCGASGGWYVLGASERYYREQQLWIRSCRGKAGIKATLMPGWKPHRCLTKEAQTCISLLIVFETDKAMGASNIRGAENAKKACSRINLLTGQRKLLNIFCQALSHGKYGPVRLLRCLAPFSTLGLGLPKFALL
jgi:hypothetical protein